MALRGQVKYALLGLALCISYLVIVVMFGVIPAPHKGWKHIVTGRKGREDYDKFDSLLCHVDDTTHCTDKEKRYIKKMEAKTRPEIQTQFVRLNDMKKDGAAAAMSATNKLWLHQRVNILKELGAVEIKPWRVCHVDDTTDCSPKEKVYIQKNKGKTQDEIEKERARLVSMKGDAMSVELKNWLLQRLRILEGLLRAELPVKDEVKPWRVIQQWLYHRLGLRAPPVNDDEVKLPWRVLEREEQKEEAKEPEKKEEEPAKEVNEAEREQDESLKEETKESTTAASDGEEEVLEL